MTQGIQITSVEALRDFQTSLVQYRHKVEDALLCAAIEAQRVMSEVEDSLAAATQHIEQCRAAVAQARANLNSCLRGGNEEKLDCSDDELALKEAEVALRKAEERIDVLQRERVRLEDAVEGYRSKAECLKAFLEVDLTHAHNTLTKKIEAVEHYLTVVSPGIATIPFNIPPTVALATWLTIGVNVAVANMPHSLSTSKSATSCISTPPATVVASQESPRATADYCALRKRTPSPEVRTLVTSEGAQVDPIYGHQVSKLEPDHIVPVKTIVRMPGFADLPLDEQIAILNMPLNFIGVSRQVNASRGDRSWEQWRGHSRFGPMPERVRENMILRERAVRLRIEHSIREGRRHD